MPRRRILAYRGVEHRGERMQRILRIV